MDYDKLVNRLRVWSLDERRGDGMLLVRTSNAIVQLQARVAELEGNHCADCCCARSWAALGVTEYTGKSIPEHIAAIKNDLAAALDEVARLQDENRGLRAEFDSELAAARAESDLAHWLLRNARKYMNPMHEALCAAIDNVLQKKQAALAGKDAT